MILREIDSGLFQGWVDAAYRTPFEAARFWVHINVRIISGMRDTVPGPVASLDTPDAGARKLAAIVPTQADDSFRIGG